MGPSSSFEKGVVKITPDFFEEGYCSWNGMTPQDLSALAACGSGTAAQRVIVAYINN
jgi:hypothetical protein